MNEADLEKLFSKFKKNKLYVLKFLATLQVGEIFTADDLNAHVIAAQKADGMPKPASTQTPPRVMRDLRTEKIIAYDNESKIDGLYRWVGFTGRMSKEKKSLRQRLKDLGYGSYEEYTAGDWWVSFREGWFQRHPNAVCVVTGRKDNLILHHLDYERINGEWDSDVVPLYGPLHNPLHLIQKRYKIKFDQAHLLLKHTWLIFSKYVPPA